MEIRIADRWNWVTIDSGGAKWVWEGKPYYDEGSCTWEEDVAGDSRCIWLVELNFGEDIEHDKDKIWKRNGEDWEYAGGQVTEEKAGKELVKNRNVILGYLKLQPKGRGELIASVDTIEESIEFIFSGETKVEEVQETYMAFANLAQLIKDAEGGKDAN